MKILKLFRNRPKPSRSPRGKPTKGDELNQATTEEFEREGMGIAPKE
jgi:hypothetical protein